MTHGTPSGPIQRHLDSGTSLTCARKPRDEPNWKQPLLPGDTVVSAAVWLCQLDRPDVQCACRRNLHGSGTAQRAVSTGRPRQQGVGRDTGPHRNRARTVKPPRRPTRRPSPAATTPATRRARTTAGSIHRSGDRTSCIRDDPMPVSGTPAPTARHRPDPLSRQPRRPGSVRATLRRAVPRRPGLHAGLRPRVTTAARLRAAPGRGPADRLCRPGRACTGVSTRSDRSARTATVHRPLCGLDRQRPRTTDGTVHVRCRRQLRCRPDGAGRAGRIQLRLETIPAQCRRHHERHGLARRRPATADRSHSRKPVAAIPG